MCGVVGLVAKSHVNQMLFDALTVLQHRGQDASGIVTSHQGRLYLRKNNGMVRDVFRTRHMRNLLGRVGIGHVRYPTAGSSSSAEAQPFYVNSPYGITLAHNGNLVNAEQLAQDLFREDLRHVNTGSDSEVLLNVFAHELQKVGGIKLTPDTVFLALSQVFERCKGAYAVVSMIPGYGIIAFRDPHGIRPLVYGYRDTSEGREYMVASESVALDTLGFTLERDVLPGEAICITESGELYAHVCAKQVSRSPCIFEYVYLSRPDSVIEGISVYQARLQMGVSLADKILREWVDHDIDVIIPIPDTSRTAALEMANRLGVIYREGFIKNRYIGRTFIMPGQSERKKSVRQKLNAIDVEFNGRNVLLVDDSIVRGTTCNQIVQMARDAGARKVYFASAAPPVRYPNVYGIDMAAAHELIAHGRTVEEVCERIGADRLIYQDLKDLCAAVSREGDGSVTQFDTCVFSGEYITGNLNQLYFDRLEARRSDVAKQQRPLSADLADHDSEPDVDSDGDQDDKSACLDLYNGT
ncbi:MAG: amidophosphoribosyltransferase [Gammaproteobacteria bacterium]